MSNLGAGTTFLIASVVKGITRESAFGCQFEQVHKTTGELHQVGVSMQAIMDRTDI